MEAELSPLKEQSFLSDSVCLVQELLNNILVRIQDMDSFSLEQYLIRNRQLSLLTSDLGRFVEITTLCAKLLSPKDRDFMGLVKSSHIHLLFILKGINQVQQKQDILALEELIKYELKDNLTQWKIDFIPKIKRLLNA